METGSMAKLKKLSAILAIVACAALALFIHARFFHPEFFYSGTLEATRVVIPARISSQIQSFPVKEGDRLEGGQIVAQQDDEDLKISLTNAKSKYKRGATLYRQGHFSAADLEALGCEKDEIELKIRWCGVRSPVSGIVLSKYKEEGEWASQGEGLLSVANIREIWSYFYVEQSKVSQLALGMKVVGSLPEVPGRVFNGRIIKINSEPEFTPKNVQTRKERTRLVYGVKVLFENAHEDLKPGMTIETTFGSPAAKHVADAE